MTTLSEEQLAGVEKAEEWYQYANPHSAAAVEVPLVFKWSGYAGTGKTTAIKVLVERLGVKPLYAAPTGKAALAMRKINDVDAHTIHHLIYKYVPPDMEACEELYNRIHDDDSDLSVDEKNKLQAELDELNKPHFVIKEDSMLIGAKLLIVDEASMVNDEVLEDLLSFGVPIIAMGDPGQLPPVQGQGAIFIGQPDVMLTEIHRQAADNPIIAAVTQARKGVPWPYRLARDYDPEAKFQHLMRRDVEGTPNLEAAIMRDSDIILTGMNETRYGINTKMRRMLGYDITDPYPQVGEKICCWKNEKELNLFNGLMAEVVDRGELYDEYVELFIKTDLHEPGDKPQKVHALRAYFDNYYDNQAMKAVKWWMRKDRQEFDFGYCITVHKSQGSQWDTVLFYDDGLFRGWKNKSVERKQFVYTAGTRAAERLIVIS